MRRPQQVVVRDGLQLRVKGSVFYACGGRIPLSGTGADWPSARNSGA